MNWWKRLLSTVHSTWVSSFCALRKRQGGNPATLGNPARQILACGVRQINQLHLKSAVGQTALLRELLNVDFIRRWAAVKVPTLPFQGLLLVVAAGRTVFTPRPKRGSEPHDNAEWMGIKIAALALVSYYAVCAVFCSGPCFFLKGIFDPKNAGKSFAMHQEYHVITQVPRIHKYSVGIFRIAPLLRSRWENIIFVVRKWFSGPAESNRASLCWGSKGDTDVVPTLDPGWWGPRRPFHCLLHVVSPSDLRVSQKASGCEVPSSAAATTPTKRAHSSGGLPPYTVPNAHLGAHEYAFSRRVSGLPLWCTIIEPISA